MGASREKQIPDLLDPGYHVITYDRGVSASPTKPATGYDYEILARDLHKLVETQQFPIGF